MHEADLSAMCTYMAGLCASPPSLAMAHTHRAGDMTTLQHTLEAAATRTLMQRAAGSAAVAGSALEDLLLAGLAVALRDGLGRQGTLVTLESHGRQWPARFSPHAPSLDVSRTVGWFTTYVPMLLEASPGQDLAAVARAVRTRRDTIPDAGWSYSLLDLHPDMLEGRDQRRADIGFNYLGVFDDGAADTGTVAVDWSPAGEPIGADTRSPHAIDLLCRVAGGRLELSLTFDPAAVTSVLAQRLLHELTHALTLGEGENDAVAMSIASSHSFTYQMSEQDLDELLDL